MSLNNIITYIESKILYEDNHVIALVKPPNIPTQSDSSGDISLYDHVKDYIKLKYDKQGNVFLGIVHRLDRPVSGIMVFAKTSKAASRLSESIRNREFYKTYYAVINGIPSAKEDTLENYLIKKTNKLGSIAQVVFDDKKDKSAKLARLSYSVLEELPSNNLSLIKVELETGRFHQIRVQLSNLGHAIYGDRKYGGYIKYDKDFVPLGLFAKTLKFKHPTKDEMIDLKANAPNTRPWALFSNK